MHWNSKEAKGRRFIMSLCFLLRVEHNHHLMSSHKYTQLSCWAPITALSFIDKQYLLIGLSAKISHSLAFNVYLVIFSMLVGSGNQLLIAEALTCKIVFSITVFNDCCIHGIRLCFFLLFSPLYFHTGRHFS